MGAAVREYEILRIAAGLHGKDTAAAADTARREVLAWAQNRTGGRLPEEAWNLASFEYFSGGRNSVAIRLQSDASDLWAIRAEDPDKKVPGRIWTTEVVIGTMAGQRPRFSARLLVNTTEFDLEIEPHAPGFVQQVVEKCGLYQGDTDFEAEPALVNSAIEVDALIELLVDPQRAVPVFVLTVPDTAKDGVSPLMDARELSRAVLGMGHVVVLTPAFTPALTSRFGRFRSVFGGGVRAYLPGFSDVANPYDHRLVVGADLRSEGQHRAARWMRSIAANESVRRNRLGRDVLAFATIRNASLQVRQEQLTEEGASDSEQLDAARSRIAALENAIEEDKQTLEFFDNETSKAEERAAAAEALHRAAVFHIQQLQGQLKAAGTDPNASITSPAAWSEFAEWCDTQLAGRVALAPAARRGVRSPTFDDMDLAARCLVWLATDYRSGRINGAEGDFRDKILEPGVKNSPCGGDEFDFEWQGRRVTADWHIKNGGNTRDPQRCLRVYYYWEPETQLVVIADMPSHRRSSIT